MAAGLLIWVLPSGVGISTAELAQNTSTEIQENTSPVLEVLEGRNDVTMIRDGVEVAVGEGLQLQSGDTVTTGRRGGVRLRLNKGAEVRIDALAKIYVGDDAGTPVLHLKQGRIEGQVADAAGVRIAFRNAKSIVSLVHGRVGILRIESGRLAVAAMNGDALLEIDGREFLVPHDHYVPIHEGMSKSIAVVTTLPKLEIHVTQVKRPGIQQGKRRRAKITGTTHRDVMLIVENRYLKLNRGHFVAMVTPKRDGTVMAVLRDASGRTVRRSLEVLNLSSKTRWAPR